MTLAGDPSNLPGFLLARIAEDERAATAVRPGPRTVRTNAPDIENFLTVWHPDRALAECDAKRRIVEWAQHVDGGWICEQPLPLLALPYADHPDYQSAWRP